MLYGKGREKFSLAPFFYIPEVFVKGSVKMRMLGARKVNTTKRSASAQNAPIANLEDLHGILSVWKSRVS